MYIVRCFFFKTPLWWYITFDWLKKCVLFCTNYSWVSHPCDHAVLAWWDIWRMVLSYHRESWIMRRRKILLTEQATVYTTFFNLEILSSWALTTFICCSVMAVSCPICDKILMVPWRKKYSQHTVSNCDCILSYLQYHKHQSNWNSLILKLFIYLKYII